MELNRGTSVKSDNWAIRRDKSETETVQYKVALFTNTKLHMGFRTVPKSVTFSDLERLSGRQYSLFHIKRQLSEPTALNSLKLDPYCPQQKCTPRESSFWQCNMLYARAISAPSVVAELFVYWMHWTVGGQCNVSRSVGVMLRSVTAVHSADDEYS